MSNNEKWSGGCVGGEFCRVIKVEGVMRQKQYILSLDGKSGIKFDQYCCKMHAATPHETSKRRPPKKVLKILDNFSSKSEGLTSTLFIGDLSVICDEIKLYELFSRFGVVETVQLKKSDRDPQRAHLGYGFIKFSTRESAERALQEMDGYFFLGRAMRVAWALDFGKQQSPPSMEKATAQIHVMFVTRELNRRVSELDLGAVFSRYGNLVDIAIKKNAINHEHGVQSGYAFLHFALTPEGLKSGITAVDAVNNLVVDNIAYQCKVTHTLRAQFMSMNSSEELSGVGMKVFPPMLSRVTSTSPSLVVDPNFKTYEYPAHRMNPPRPFERDSFPQQHFIDSVVTNDSNSVSEYYGKGYHSSSGMDPTLLMTEHGLSPSPSSLDHHELSLSLKMASDYRTMNSFARRGDVNSPNFTVNNNNKNQSSITAQNYLYSSHDHYHREQPVAGPFSLSSSFVSLANEEVPLRRRNNNTVMKQPYNNYNRDSNNYDDLSRF